MEQPDTVTPSSGQNSSSRAQVMTPARLARKRKADRESQRASRLKQKTYVAHLEAMVKSLDAPEGTDPVELVKQQGAENIEIKKALSAICKIAQTALGTGGRPSLATSSSPDATTDTGDGQYMNVEPYKCEKTQTAKVSPSMNDFDVETIACMANFPSLFTDDDADLQDFIPHDLLDFAMQGSVDEQTLNTTARICDRDAAIMDEPPPIPWNCGPVIEYSGNHPDARDRDWAFTVDLLNKPVVFSLETPEDVNDGDIPISAVLRGWDTVAARQPLDAGWKVLREFDQNIFSGCGIAERLAVLRMMRLMSNYLTTAERRPELPAFMLKRPCQEYIRHHPSIDYLVWPGLRERLVFAQQEFACDGDRYTALFQANFRFLWPFEPEEIYCRNPATGRYSFSEQFIRRTEDLSCWTMHSDYFIALPELRGDIPTFSFPPTYNLSPLTPVVQHPGQRIPLNALRDGQESAQDDRYSVSIDRAQVMWGKLSQIS